MRLRFGEEPGAAGEPAVSLPPVEIFVAVSTYTPNFGDGVQVHVASPPKEIVVVWSTLASDPLASLTLESYQAPAFLLSAPRRESFSATLPFSEADDT